MKPAKFFWSITLIFMFRGDFLRGMEGQSSQDAGREVAPVYAFNAATDISDELWASLRTKGFLVVKRYSQTSETELRKKINMVLALSEISDLSWPSAFNKLKNKYADKVNISQGTLFFFFKNYGNVALFDEICRAKGWNSKSPFFCQSNALFAHLSDLEGFKESEMKRRYNVLLAEHPEDKFNASTDISDALWLEKYVAWEYVKHGRFIVNVVLWLATQAAETEAACKRMIEVKLAEMDRPLPKKLLKLENLITGSAVLRGWFFQLFEQLLLSPKWAAALSPGSFVMQAVASAARFNLEKLFALSNLRKWLEAPQAYVAGLTVNGAEESVVEAPV